MIVALAAGVPLHPQKMHGQVGEEKRSILNRNPSPRRCHAQGPESTSQSRVFSVLVVSGHGMEWTDA